MTGYFHEQGSAGDEEKVERTVRTWYGVSAHSR